MKRVMIVLIGLALVACGGPKKATSTTGNKTSRYSEDLSAVRPHIKVPADSTLVPPVPETQNMTIPPARYAVTEPLNAVLDTISAYHTSRRYIEGYTIQVYTGDKEGALTAKRRLTMALPDLDSEIKFDPPTFRVRVGRYMRTLDAQKDFVAIKKHFSSAILVPHKIAL